MIAIAVTGLYRGGFQSVPLSLLESTVRGVRTSGGVWGGGLGKNEVWGASRQLPLGQLC